MSRLSCGGEKNTRDVFAPRALRAHRPSPPARQALAQHGAATEEKTRGEDDDRRRDERRGQEGENHRGARYPGGAAAVRTTRDVLRVLLALRARRPSPPACQALAQHGAATEEKTRGEDDDRRRDERKGQEGENHRGARCPGRAAAVRTTRDVRVLLALRARRPSPPARQALAQHGAATEGKTRDEDDDRRRDNRKGPERKDGHGTRCPG